MDQSFWALKIVTIALFFVRLNSAEFGVISDTDVVETLVLADEIVKGRK